MAPTSSLRTVVVVDVPADLTGPVPRALETTVREHGGSAAPHLRTRQAMCAWFDDPERALRCAEELYTSHAGGGTGTDGAGADVRVGVSSGVVQVVGVDVFGTPVVEAERLVAWAEAGEALVAESTHRLLGGLPRAVDRGALRLRRHGAPTQAWGVRLGAGPHEGRFSSRGTAGTGAPTGG